MISDIRTNVVTGFLGTGKTSVIRHLLAQAPSGERWAVLVNEMGALGVDADWIAQQGSAGELFVAQVPGGCLCCVAGASFKVGLNRLIREARPHRLLIEPTGLGHPGRLLAQLRGPDYARVLDVRACLCVLDARQLGDRRYREHAIYQDQLAVADVLLGNKADLCSGKDRRAFGDLLAQLQRCSEEPLGQDWISHGAVDARLLDWPGRGVNALEGQAPSAAGLRSGGVDLPTACWSKQDLLEAVSALEGRDEVWRLKGFVPSSEGAWWLNAVAGVNGHWELELRSLPAVQRARLEWVALEGVDLSPWVDDLLSRV